MEKVTIYKHCWWDGNVIITRYGLYEYEHTIRNDSGWGDSGVEYKLPAGYSLGVDGGGELGIFDASGGWVGVVSRSGLPALDTYPATPLRQVDQEAPT